MNYARSALILVLLVWLPQVSVLACRYNVRDVGFVDLGTEPYTLICYVRDNTLAEHSSQVLDAARSVFRDSNVQTEMVNMDRQTNHPALKHLPQPWPAELPAAVLVSPDGQTLRMPISETGAHSTKKLEAVFEEIVASPTRSEILRTVSQTFGAVLLIEGENAVENSRARQVIASALDQIRAQMKSLPKLIAQPPAMIVLETAALVREKVFLWALGLGTASTSEPRAAILYGKARWIGPLMKGREITERNLTGILSIIGADCECDLDIGWTQGTRLPVRWGESLHAQTAKGLGFDPENPMVKTEVSRILGRSGISKRNTQRNQETSPAKTANSEARETAAGESNSSTSAAQVPGGDLTAAALPADATVFKRAVLVVAVLAVLIVVLAALILVRVARRRWLESAFDGKSGSVKR